MKKSVLNSSAVLPLLNVVTKLKLSQLEIPEEWDELFERKEKKQFIQNLKKQIEKSGYCNPIVVFKFEDKYVIVDGVLRFLAVQDLNLNEVDCIILDICPNSRDEVKDWIIEFNLKSVPSLEERKRLLSHYLRVIDTESELDESTYNEKYKFISEQYGRGWGRNNVITFKKSLVFEKENPENSLNLSNKLLENEVSFDRVKCVLDILDDERNNYDLEKEKEAKVIDGFLNKKYDLRKTESLVRQYNHKKETGTTDINIVREVSSEKYMILPGNSLDTKFPKGTIINGIITSIPYYNQIEYSEKDSKNSEFEIGREKKPELFVRNIVDVMKIGADNMTEDGVIIINLHDSYQDGICLGVVHLLATEMQKAGFFYIDQVIWQKSNNKPQGNKTKRFVNGYESVLLFSKSRNYYYNQLKIYDPSKSATVKKGCSEQGNKGADGKYSFHISNQYRTVRNFLCDNDIEQILKLNISKERSQQNGLQTGFFGSFPTLLPIPFLLSFFPEDGTVWDPFGGTGTTGRAALMLNRKVIISELYDKNIPKIKEVLEKGISEFNEEDYINLKNDFLSSNDHNDLAA
ncbi:DNA modification methylase [Chryseobacterium sp. SORGH_AS 447]|uniref:DNA methyltransferase n=1 Tax=Chryseobacterium sp. SORGH_AS_0447 TaxID=3041769 RepID=UPI00277D50A3|nr:DNA methyltransferase [Chryseobacterium sp. SORGH_AS_0447]MDQ1160654.1 DNA modification methylase [Chryseobacterium sp. SORGH_AS_0447]